MWLERPSLRQAMASDKTYREKLETLRDYLAARLDEDPHARDAAPLAQRLAEVLKMLEELPDPAKGSAVDELAAERARRLAGQPRAASQ